MVVHPGASVPARAIPPPVAAGLVDVLHAEGVRVVVGGGRSEADLVDRVVGPPPPGVGAFVGHSFRDLSGLLAGASCAVVGNTGPAHLAAAVAVPVVSVFAPVVPPERWRPWRAAGQLFGAVDIECRGCRSRVCPRPDQPCLEPATPRRSGGRPHLGRCVVRILLWHVHGSWTTAFVQGRHTYLVPVLPDRGPDGRGRARTWDWPDSVLEVGPDELARAEVDLVVLQRPHEEELARAWLGGRRPGIDVPAIWLEHNTPPGTGRRDAPPGR